MSRRPYTVPEGVERERAKEVSHYASKVVPNGPTAHDLRLASFGLNEDLLYAIHMILTREDQT